MPDTTTPATVMTPARRLATTLYGLHSTTSNKLDDDVQTMLESGYSWRAIRDKVAANTDGEVSVSYESLRTWYGHLKPENVA